MSDSIAILLATYNGEKYLHRQLDSLLNQTYTDWHLYVRDDRSKDNTMSVLNTYLNNYPHKITIVENREGNGGSIANFNALLQVAKDASYVMFCDQDDEWEKDKIEISLLKMQKLEKQFGKDCPLMVFTNFQYVDEQMNVIESKKNFRINRIANFGFPQLFAQNPVYGCTTISNRALVTRVGFIPQQSENHDHWIALVASAFGKLYYLDKKTVRYRQHANNVSGNFDNNSFQKRFRRIFFQKKNYKDIVARRSMLLFFKQRYYSALDKKHQSVLDNFLIFYDHKSLPVFFKNVKNNIRCQTLLQTFLFYVTLIFAKFDKDFTR